MGKLMASLGFVFAMFSSVFGLQSCSKADRMVATQSAKQTPVWTAPAPAAKTPEVHPVSENQSN